MRIEVLNTGTELLLGHVINTHVRVFAEALFPLGLRIQRQVAVPDGEPIRGALLEAFERSDLLLVTGGLGPTTDDITREITAEVLGVELIEDARIVAAIHERFARRSMQVTPRNYRQAQRPAAATVLENPHGTAPGLYLPPLDLPHPTAACSRSPHLFLLPGPPRELIPMFENLVLPRIAALRPPAPPHVMRMFKLVGMGESAVEARVGEELLAMDLEVGYCARPSEVEIRLIGPEEKMARAEELIAKRLGRHVFTRDLRSLEKVIVDVLTARGETLAVAESCTGGFIAHRITNVPGASAVFLAGYTTYANEAKASTLGVDPALIEAHGAVSEPVARAMAEGALARSGATFALSTTGIAGPDGGTAEKPVGTVFVGCGMAGHPTHVERLFFPGERDTFKQHASQAALDILRRRIEDLAPPGR